MCGAGVCAAPGVERGGLLALECDTHPPVEGVASSKFMHAQQASPQLLQDRQHTPPFLPRVLVKISLLKFKFQAMHVLHLRRSGVR